MIYFSDSIVFATRADLAAIPADQLIDKMFYCCEDTGNGLIGWYQYQSDNTASVDYDGFNPTKPYFVVAATNGTGNFILMSPLPDAIQNTGSPDGSINAIIVGQQVIDVTNSYLWIQNTPGTAWTYAVELTYVGGGS